jgi:hypothetical protein
MTKNTALIERQALALFNFMSMKHQNNKRIGELTVGDFVEMCTFLAKMKDGNTKNPKLENLNDNLRSPQNSQSSPIKERKDK